MLERDVIAILADIEASLDVNRITYRNICAWPFIRNQLANYLLHQDDKYLPSHSLPAITRESLAKISQLARLAVSRIKDRRSLPLPECDILFLARSSERGARYKGKWYNRHSDSFSDLFADRKVQIIEINDAGQTRREPHRQALRIDLPLLLNRIQFEISRPFLTERIQHYRSLERCLNARGITPNFSEASLRRELSLILFHKRIFKRILAKCRPKVLFIVCYYYRVALAAILACRDFRIPVVEFQHGAQSDFNPFITHWSQIPGQGYQMLPDYFWSWGKSSADRINRWAERTSSHQAFIGGNLWISKWMNEDFKTDECDVYDTGTIFPSGYRHILISLQLWPADFPDFLLEIIKNSPPNWYWHIRQHPRLRAYQKEMRACFLSLPGVQIEERNARDMPLYLLLKHVDVHLTGYSTVAVEAGLFNVPTIFYHPSAKDSYQDLLDDRLFFYADTPIRMSRILANLPSAGKTDSSRNTYVRADTATHVACLEQILLTAQQQVASDAV